MSAQHYELTIEERPEYLYVCVQAEAISLDIATAYINEMMPRLRASGHKKVLFVRETPMMISQTHYAIIASVISNMLPKDVMFALVDRSPAHRIITKTVEEQANEKALNLRAFDDFDEAEKWLISSDASNAPPPQNP